MVTTSGQFWVHDHMLVQFLRRNRLFTTVLRRWNGLFKVLWTHSGRSYLVYIQNINLHNLSAHLVSRRKVLPTWLKTWNVTHNPFSWDLHTPAQLGSPDQMLPWTACPMGNPRFTWELHCQCKWEYSGFWNVTVLRTWDSEKISQCM